MSSSSSGSEDDEERRKLAQALDPDFLRGVESNSQKNGDYLGSGKNNGVKVPERDLPASKRAKIFNDNPERNEFTKLYSLDVTPASQEFIAKQLAKSLEKSLKEVSPPLEPVETNDANSGIKLFATSTSKVTERDLETRQISRRPRPRKLKRKSKSKRKREQDESTDSSESETERLKSVAVTADWVLKQ